MQRSDCYYQGLLRRTLHRSVMLPGHCASVITEMKSPNPEDILTT